MRDGRTGIILGCARRFVPETTFFNYRDCTVNKSQTIDCLLTIDVFKSPFRDSNEHFSVLVDIKRFRLIKHEDLFCRSDCLSLL